MRRCCSRNLFILWGGAARAGSTSMTVHRRQLFPAVWSNTFYLRNVVLDIPPAPEQERKAGWSLGSSEN